MIICRSRTKLVAKGSAALLVLLLIAGCPSLRSTSSNRVAQRIAHADEAYQRLDPDHVPAYNDAIELLAREIDGETPEQLRSELAESWLGHFAVSLIHLPTDLQSDIVNVVSANPDAATPMAKAFHRELNISSVRTLSPRDPALQSLAALPVEVPFHSIIGQHNAAPIEKSSDGVVSYSSAHLDGATSELLVRSGHGVCENPDAQREVARILRLELQYRLRVTKMVNRPLQPCAHSMLRRETESFTTAQGDGKISTWTTQSLLH